MQNSVRAGLPTCVSSNLSTSPIFTSESKRTKAQQLGYTGSEYRANLLISLGGSFRPRQFPWVHPKTGVSLLPLPTQTPQYRADTLQDL